MKIGVVAVSSRFAKERGEAIQAWFDLQFPLGEVTVAFMSAPVPADPQR